MNVCERTNASTTGLLDVRTGDWDAELLALVGLDRAQLPELVDPGTVIGKHDGLATRRRGGRLPRHRVGGRRRADDRAATRRTSRAAPGGWSASSWTRPVLTERGPRRQLHQRGRRRRAGPLPHQRDGHLAAVARRCAAWGDGRPRRRARAGRGVRRPGAGLRRAGPAVPAAHASDMPARIADWCREHGVEPPDGRAATVLSIVRSLAEAFAHAVDQAVVAVGPRRTPRARRRRRRPERAALPAARRPARPAGAGRPGRGDRPRQRAGPGSRARRGLGQPRGPAGAGRPHPPARSPRAHERSHSDEAADAEGARPAPAAAVQEARAVGQDAGGSRRR